MFDISRIAAIAPDLRSADLQFNVTVLTDEYRQAVRSGASLVLFPAMAAGFRSRFHLCRVPFGIRYRVIRISHHATPFFSASSSSGLISYSAHAYT